MCDLRVFVYCIYSAIFIFYNGGEVMKMLVALNENKQYVILTPSHTVEQIQEMRKLKFHCPQCAAPVILKAGPIKIPHFAHKQKSVCDQLFSERESLEHLMGKFHFYEWLTSLNVPVQLEATIPAIQQRPDVLAKVKGQQFAIEFQCSPISEELFQTRSNGYRLNNITPIWIPKNMHKLKRWQVQSIKLSHFQRLFIQEGRIAQFYVSYDVSSSHFIYFTNLLFLKPTECVTAVTSIPLTAQHLPLLQPTPVSKEIFKQMFGLFRNRQQAYIQSTFVFGQAKIQSLLWRSLYELRILYDKIPLTVGLPIKYSEFVGTSTLEWQAAFHYFLQLYQIPISRVNDSIIVQFLKWANYNHSSKAQLAIRNYINVCIEMNIETVHSAVLIMQLVDTIYMQFVAISEKN